MAKQTSNEVMWPDNLTDAEFREQVMAKLNLSVLVDIITCPPPAYRPQQQDNTANKDMKHARKTA